MLAVCVNNAKINEFKLSTSSKVISFILFAAPISFHYLQFDFKLYKLLLFFKSFKADLTKHTVL